MFDLPTFTLENLMWLPGLIAGFTVHELGHALVAYWMGDRGQLTRERLSLNPVKHVSWLGLAVFVLVGFGWAKPVSMRPAAFKHPNLGSLLVSLAGVTVNALLALGLLVVVFFIAMAGTIAAGWLGLDREVVGRILFGIQRPDALSTLVASFTIGMVNVNVVLAVFNLIPIPGFDGFHALLSLGRLVTRYQLPAQDRQRAQAVVAFEEGNHYVQASQMSRAVEAWRRALGLYPQFYGAWYNLGVIYAQAGQRSAALGALASAAREAPSDGERAQVDALLKQAGWQSEERPAPVSPEGLPELAAVPDWIGRQETADRRRWLRLVGLSVGLTTGLLAYTVLMTVLALVAAGWRW